MMRVAPPARTESERTLTSATVAGTMAREAAAPTAEAIPAIDRAGRKGTSHASLVTFGRLCQPAAAASIAAARPLQDALLARDQAHAVGGVGGDVGARR